MRPEPDPISPWPAAVHEPDCPWEGRADPALHVKSPIVWIFPTDTFREITYHYDE